MPLIIRPHSCGCFASKDGTAGPIFLEVYEGRLQLLVWSDINEEDPSHITELEGSREDRRL